MNEASYKLWERVQHLEDLKDGLDYLAKDLYVLREEFNVKDFNELLFKNSRTVLKRKIAIRLKELRKNLILLEGEGKAKKINSQAIMWVGGESGQEEKR